jgi:uncharacterized RDD family membrane protein YckC
MQIFIVQSGEKQGPFTEAEIRRELMIGRIHPQSLAWYEGLADWVPLSSVLSDPSAGDPEGMHAPGLFVPSGPQIRPWTRFFARSIDYIIVSLVSAFVIALVYEPLLEMPDLLFSMLIVFLYVFIEPALLDSWGTTPGKALLNVNVRKSNGSKPSYQEALIRSLNVWIKGMGLGIGIVSLFTNAVAYNKLTKSGLTSWDKNGGFIVQHKKLGAGRVIVAALIYLIFLYLIIQGNAEISA